MDRRYTILECSDLVSLVNSVNELLTDGWYPVGGLSVIWHDYYGPEGEPKNEMRCYQAMVQR